MKAKKRAARTLENWACSEQVPFDVSDQSIDINEQTRETFLLNVEQEIHAAETEAHDKGWNEAIEACADWLTTRVHSALIVNELVGVFKRESGDG